MTFRRGSDWREDIVLGLMTDVRPVVVVLAVGSDIEGIVAAPFVRSDCI